MGIFNNSLFNLITGRGQQTPAESFRTFGASTTNSGESVDTERALEEATLLTGVQVIAQGISQLKIVVVDNTTNEELDSRLAISRLLKRPNDFQTMHEFMYNGVVNLLTKGEVFIKIKRHPKSGEPMEMLHINPRLMTVSVNHMGMPLYKHDQYGLIPFKDIIHYRDVVTDAPHGQSRVTLAKELIGAKKAADALIGRTFKNGITMDYIIKTDKTVDEETAKKYIANIKKTMGRQNRQNFTIMDAGTDVSTVKGMTPADSDLRAIRQELISEIAALLRVPAFMVGGSGDEKYSNVRQKHASLYRDTFAPIINVIEQAMTHRLVMRGNARIHLDVSQLLKGDVESTANVAMKMVTAQIWTINEGREYTGKPAIDGMDILVESGSGTDDNDVRGTEDLPNATDNPDAQNGDDNEE